MSKRANPDPPPGPEEGSRRRTCFLIARIDDSSSPERRQTDGLLEAVIQPALDQAGFDITAAHLLDQSGSISNQIINRLLDADLVVADITGHNPNVMYELGVRHSARLPAVILREAGTRIPFDVQSDRVVDYRNDFMGVVELQRELKAKAKAAVQDREPDNPVYAARGEAVIREIVSREGTDVDKLILDRLDAIEDRLPRQTTARRDRSLVNMVVSIKADQARDAILRLKKLGASNLVTLSSNESHTEIAADLSIPSSEVAQLGKRIASIPGVFGASTSSQPEPDL